MDADRTLSIIAFICLLTSIAPSGTAVAAGAVEEVLFSSSGIALSGDLHFPETRPKAGLVLIHGSARKDSVRMSALARLLADAGFAVLTYDKRGIGESGGSFQDTDDEKAFALLADDAAAAFRELQGHPRMAGTAVGILGISQGGWVGPIAATRVESAAFMVLWSGPVCTVAEELHFSAFAKKVPSFSMEAEAPRVRKHMESALRRESDWDPREVLSRLSLPTLWIFGGRDRSIPVELSVARLEEMIKDGHRNFEYRIFPEQGHSLDYPTSHPAGYEFMLRWMSDRLQPMKRMRLGHASALERTRGMVVGLPKRVGAENMKHPRTTFRVRPLP
jgi:pimeloyl-ACP methyl ester carboxylesterase